MTEAVIVSTARTAPTKSFRGSFNDTEAPVLGGETPAIEYALKMRQFPQEQLLSAVQARGELGDAHIDALAEQIAAFHLSAPRVPQDHPLGTAEAVGQSV